MTSFVEDAAQAVAGIFAEIDVATAGFAARSGLRCAAGCGACCRKPGVEASVLEMLPAAALLLVEGEAASQTWYDRAAADPSGPCIFYRPTPGDATRGRCSAYAVRPGLCRLFGYATVRRKDGRAALAACAVLRVDQADRVAATNAALDDGTLTDAPSLGAFSTRLGLSTAEPSLGEVLPINAALARAIEKMALGVRV